ncbi:AIM24 family protein [Eisenibacter elegans]|uniref:AIM24 family protein n=1 Tax=Eisenibacter elegans TaxID=997 RepID=UPI000415D6AA|nr:AIM24 family protein [Eisenibacter elegans]
MSQTSLTYRVIDEYFKQILEIKLEPGRALQGDARALLYLDEEVAIQTQAIRLSDYMPKQAPPPPPPEAVFEEEDDDDDWSDAPAPKEEEDDYNPPLIEKAFWALKSWVRGRKIEFESEDTLPPDLPPWEDEEDDILEEEEDIPPPSQPPPPTEKPYFYLTRFQNNSEYLRTVAFVAPRMGRIVRIDLEELHEQTLLFQRGAFLCASAEAVLSHYDDLDVALNAYDKHGFVLEKLQGQGTAFVYGNGVMVEKLLNDDVIEVNLANVIAYEPSISMDLSRARRLTTLYGQAQTILVPMAGTGSIWLQTSHLHQFAQDLTPYFPVAQDLMAPIMERVEASLQDLGGVQTETVERSSAAPPPPPPVFAQMPLEEKNAYAADDDDLSDYLADEPVAMASPPNNPPEFDPSAFGKDDFDSDSFDEDDFGDDDDDDDFEANLREMMGG